MSTNPSLAQDDHLTLKLNDDGSRYLALTGYFQVWMRWSDHNPGTLDQSGEPLDQSFDVSVRRMRLGIRGVLFPKVYTYLRFGLNNLNYISGQRASVELFEAYMTLRLYEQFHFGAGKSVWHGLSRLSTPGASSSLGTDINLIALPTINRTDDFNRRLNVFTKGIIGNMDYRFTIFTPYALSDPPELNELSANRSAFVDGTMIGISGYIKWYFAEKESNLTPFSTGTYFDKKNVLNVGAGFEFQPDRTGTVQNNLLVKHDFKAFSIDFFMNKRLKENRAVTTYLAYYNYDFGPNYLRNIGINNSAVAVDPTLASFNGPGLAYPTHGTGQVIYAQAGFYQAYEKGKGFMPYLDFNYSHFDLLENDVFVWNTGISWVLNYEAIRFSVNYQNRPVYEVNSSDQLIVTNRAGSVIFQIQAAFKE